MKISGTGMKLPNIATIETAHSGSPKPTPIGTAPRSSINGTIETRKTIINFKSILGLLYHIRKVLMLEVEQGRWYNIARSIRPTHINTFSSTSKGVVL